MLLGLCITFQTTPCQRIILLEPADEFNETKKGMCYNAASDVAREFTRYVE